MLTILERINQIKGVKGSSIVSPDGIEIVSHFRTPVPSDFISALIVSVQQVANKIVSKAQTGALMQTMIEATEGKFFVQVVELSPRWGARADHEQERQKITSSFHRFVSAQSIITAPPRRESVADLRPTPLAKSAHPPRQRSGA